MSRADTPSLTSAQQAQAHAALLQVDAFARAGRLAEAETACRALLAAYAYAPAMHALALLIGQRGGDATEATQWMQNAVHAMPKEPVFQNHLGSLLFQQGDLMGAKTAYRQAVHLKSSYTEACYNLGVVNAALGDAAGALAAQRKAIAADASYLPAQVQAGAQLIQLGDFDGALTLLDAAAAQAPDYFDAHYYRGVALVEARQFERAVPALERAVRIAPARFEGHMALGNALAQIGREAEALAAYKRVIEIEPGHIPAHKEFNELAWSLGHDVRPAGSYTFARSRAGDTADLLLAEAQLRLRFGEVEIPHDLLAQAAALDESRTDIISARAHTFLTEKKFEEAQEQFVRAIAAEPGTLAFRHGLAETLLQDRKPAAAFAALKEAQALEPHNQTTLGYLSLAARAQDQGEFARLVDADNWVREFTLPVPKGFADAASFNAALAEELAHLHTRKVAPMDQTLNGGTQTPGALFRNQSRLLLQLQDALRDAVGEYLGTLPDDAAHPFLSRKTNDFEFQGSWSCRLASNGFHVNHVHSQGWISSAYYVDLPGVVTAHGNDAGALRFGESPFGLGEEDRSLRLVKPAVGKLVLFPSYFWHGTVPFASDKSRLSIAFDIVPRADLKR